MNDEDLAWTVEQACLNAWPSPRQAVLGPWLVRAAGGPSRRLNSVNPLRAARYDPGAVIADAGAIYAALGQPLVFRVPALAEGMDVDLAQNGFEAGGESCTLFTLLSDDSGEVHASTEIAARPNELWFELRSRLNGRDSEADRIVRTVIDAIALPKAFVGVRTPEALVAIAFGVLDRGLLVVEAVGTDPAARGQGHARRAVARLMAWARRHGAAGACLQVAADNEPARRLYRGLGFRTDLYRYSYCTREPIG